MVTKFERVLAVIGATGLVVIGFDGITYAATGSSLILGSLNSAGNVTTVSRTTSGPVLSLHNSSASNPPFVTNGRGLVANLNSQFLSGETLAQVQGGVDSQFNFMFQRSDASQDAAQNIPSPIGNYGPSAIEAAVPGGFAYKVGGTLSYACFLPDGAFDKPTETTTAQFGVAHPDGTWSQVYRFDSGAGACATTAIFHLVIPATSIAFHAGDYLVVAVNGMTNTPTMNTPVHPNVTFSLTGTFLHASNL